jgi:hypothetical protein
MSISVRLKPEAESCLFLAASKTGKPRNALINEAIIGWLQGGGDHQTSDRVNLILAKRTRFDDVPHFDEREAVKEGRKW